MSDMMTKTEFTEMRDDMIAKEATFGSLRVSRSYGENWPENRWSIVDENGFAVAISPRYINPDDMTDARRLARLDRLELTILYSRGFLEDLSECYRCECGDPLEFSAKYPKLAKMLSNIEKMLEDGVLPNSLE